MLCANVLCAYEPIPTGEPTMGQLKHETPPAACLGVRGQRSHTTVAPWPDPQPGMCSCVNVCLNVCLLSASLPCHPPPPPHPVVSESSRVTCYSVSPTPSLLLLLSYSFSPTPSLLLLLSYSFSPTPFNLCPQVGCPSNTRTRERTLSPLLLLKLEPHQLFPTQFFAEI
jgi:hypothetical protein